MGNSLSNNTLNPFAFTPLYIVWSCCWHWTKIYSHLLPYFKRIYWGPNGEGWGCPGA